MNKPQNARWNDALVKGVVVLLVVAGVAAVALQLAEQRTHSAREQNHAAYAARLLGEVLPGSHYDAPPGLQVIMLTDQELLGSANALAAYPVYENGKAVAVALTVIAPDGYVGPVRLQVGIDKNGRVLGVRAVEHRETPGLGDRIATDKSDWIKGFNQLSLTNPRADQWELTADGGDFDQISGATITSRTVVRAVRHALEYFAAHQATLLAAKANEAANAAASN